MSKFNTTTGFPLEEEQALVVTERVASSISVLGCFFVIFTFFWSPVFRKPVNRLIFYATLGNLLYNIGTLISINGMEVGYESTLCQAQAFLVQAFLPSDAFWNLSMAINTYLAVFKKYNAARFRALEKWYFLVNFGTFSLIAFVYCLIQNDPQGDGKIFGGAVLWCWVKPAWGKLRIITCYGPAWISILISVTIYIISGRRLYMEEKRLSMMGTSPSGSFVENPFTSYKTTEIHITTEAATPCNGLKETGSDTLVELQSKLGTRTNFEEYSITIEHHNTPTDLNTKRDMNEDEIRLRNAAVRTNQAAKSYAICCSLFFVSLLVTWIPSSIFRVYTLYHPASSSFGMAYSTGLVLPLMGFWNALIYVVISWDAVMDMLTGKLDKRMRRDWHGRDPQRSTWSKDSKESWAPRTRGMSMNSGDDLESAGRGMKAETRSWLKQ